MYLTWFPYTLESQYTSKRVTWWFCIIAPFHFFLSACIYIKWIAFLNVPQRSFLMCVFVFIRIGIFTYGTGICISSFPFFRISLLMCMWKITFSDPRKKKKGKSKGTGLTGVFSTLGNICLWLDDQNIRKIFLYGKRCRYLFEFFSWKKMTQVEEYFFCVPWRRSSALIIVHGIYYAIYLRYGFVQRDLNNKRQKFNSAATCHLHNIKDNHKKTIKMKLYSFCVIKIKDF